MVWLIILGVVVIGCGIALVITAVVDRWMAKQLDDTDDDRAGVKIGAAFAVYGIILGMAVVSAQGSYSAAQQALRQEAGTLMSSVQVARALPDGLGTPIIAAAGLYVDNDLKSWGGDGYDGPGTSAVDAMHQAFIEVQGLSAYPSARTAQGNLMTDFEEIVQARAARVLTTDQHTPPLIWVLLIGGGLVVVTMSAFLRFKDRRLRIGLVCATASLITLGLMTIWALSFPYSELMGISQDPLRAVQEYIHDLQP